MFSLENCWRYNKTIILHEMELNEFYAFQAQQEKKINKIAWIM